MSHQRYTNHHQQYGRTSHHSGRPHQASPRQEYRRNQLFNERLVYQRILEQKRAEESALLQKLALWHQERAMLNARMPASIVKTAINAAVSLMGVNLYLPADARLWSYQSTRLDQEKRTLEYRLIDIRAQVTALDQQIAYLDSEIALLAFS